MKPTRVPVVEFTLRLYVDDDMHFNDGNVALDESQIALDLKQQLMDWAADNYPFCSHNPSAIVRKNPLVAVTNYPLPNQQTA